MTTSSNARLAAALPDVRFVQPRQQAQVHQAANALTTQTGQGSRSSQGDVTHLAYAARAAFGTNGSGIKIGVLSDGVTSLATSQASGDLGPVTVLPGQGGTGDEGTAMLEIIHDLAPGAQLYFATAFTSITSFATNIRALRAAGCDIIVDDVAYFAETPFQDGQAASVVSNTNGGVVIQAVNDVTADGALYFSSAGNSGHLSAGTSGTWEGDFVDGGATPLLGTLMSGRLHSFGAQTFTVVTAPAASAPTNLSWSDPLGRLGERLRSVSPERRRHGGGGQLDQHSKRLAGSVRAVEQPRRCGRADRDRQEHHRGESVPAPRHEPRGPVDRHPR